MFDEAGVIGLWVVEDDGICLADGGRYEDPIVDGGWGGKEQGGGAFPVDKWSKGKILEITKKLIPNWLLQQPSPLHEETKLWNAIRVYSCKVHCSSGYHLFKKSAFGYAVPVIKSI